MKQYECVWYNGNTNPTGYELLEFDPNEIIEGKLDSNSKAKIRDKAWELLKKNYGFTEDAKNSVLQTLYLIDISGLVNVL